MKNKAKNWSAFKSGWPVGLLLLFATGVSSAQVVIKTGVAYPQSASDYGNTERLRQRAMRDAMELALMEIQGAQVMAERGSLEYEKALYKQAEGQTTATTKQQTSYHSNARTRVRGGVKLLQVIREWREGEKYLVKLKLDVLKNDELSKEITPGTLWRQVGRPGVSLEVRASRNGGGWWKEPSFQNYLRKQLSQNEVETLVRNNGRYRIKVWQAMENSYLGEYGTWKTLCDLSFSIVDRDTGKNRAVQHLRGGPAAGFSEKEAEDNCLETASPGFTRMLMEELVVLFNGEWVNGRDYSIRVVGLPGKDTGRVRQAIADLLSVTAVESTGFSDQEISIDVTFQGQPLELAEAFSLALDEAGIKVRFQELRGNRINFVWQGSGD